MCLLWDDAGNCFTLMPQEVGRLHWVGFLSSNCVTEEADDNLLEGTFGQSGDGSSSQVWRDERLTQAERETRSLSHLSFGTSGNLSQY